MKPMHAILPASRLPGARQKPGDAWRFSELVGHLCELTSHGASAATTVAMRLVWEAQCQGEPVGWITGRRRCFYPPDAIANGVDLASLAVVRVPERHALGKAADMLVRSGAFGLVVIDGGAEARFSDRQLTRLLGLARKHGTAIVCLTRKPPAAGSLGGVVSLRAPVGRERLGPGRFGCTLQALKDKRRAPGWRHLEIC